MAEAVVVVVVVAVTYFFIVHTHLTVSSTDWLQKSKQKRGKSEGDENGEKMAW